MMLDARFLYLATIKKPVFRSNRQGRRQRWILDMMLDARFWILDILMDNFLYYPASGDPYPVSVTMPVKLGKLKHMVLGDQVDIFEFETVFSLFEFIDGIAWELSFHGIPESCEIRR